MWSQRIAEEQEKTRPKEEIPQEFQGFRKVFSDKESERMPTQKPYDHAINLVPRSKLPRSRRYPLGPKEEEALDKYLDENLRKGYIWKSGSSAASPVFYIKKKNGDLRLVVDYRRLNAITEKDQYPIPLCQELLDRLTNAQWFTTLDIRWGYNNIWI